MAEISKIIGIDFGERKVGLAIADLETKMAFAFGVLENDNLIWKKLREIISKEGIGMAIIGIPSHINRQEVRYPSEIFGEKMEAETGIEIVYHDEMFTTKMAKANLMQKGIRALDKHDDPEAARIILQSWLDTH